MQDLLLAATSGDRGLHGWMAVVPVLLVGAFVLFMRSRKR